MILQTVIDPMEVMGPATALQLPDYHYRCVGGCLLQCESRADGIYLNRIISTDLRDYLNPAYRIGEVIEKKTL